MLSTQEIIAFVPTTDSGRGRSFYEGVLGLKVTGEDAYGVMFDANGTRLRMSVVSDLSPAPHTILGWVIPDVRTMVRALEGKGVVFERYGFMEQDEWGVWQSPGGAQVAWFKDPDGNTLSVTQL